MVFKTIQDINFKTSARELTVMNFILVNNIAEIIFTNQDCLLLAFWMEKNLNVDKISRVT